MACMTYRDEVDGGLPNEVLGANSAKRAINSVEGARLSLEFRRDESCKPVQSEMSLTHRDSLAIRTHDNRRYPSERDREAAEPVGEPTVEHERVERVHRDRAREVGSRDIGNLANSGYERGYCTSETAPHLSMNPPNLGKCTTRLQKEMINIRGQHKYKGGHTGVDAANRNPCDVQNEGHAGKQVAEQKRRHIRPELRVEDVPLAVDALCAATVAELVNRDPEHAQPDKVDSDQGQRGERDDNLCIHMLISSRDLWLGRG